MEQLALPKNTNTRAASFIANKLLGRNSDLFNKAKNSKMRTKSIKLNPINTIDFLSLKKKEVDSDSDEDATPMTRISKKVGLKLVFLMLPSFCL